MIYFADLHIHSRYSRATSPDCNLVELARWAALKGLKVLGTGDFTHPKWFGEIGEMLEDAGDGLLKLKKEHAPESTRLPNGLDPLDVRFILNVEISSIYKKDGAVRKVHNLVFMPDLDSAARFNTRLGRLGNIASDGRPILGLDSRNLLEIALETDPDSFLIPAHVWTPWFSILGSKSGFDSVQECFDDLTPHIFALETGLSSDPEMNYRVSSLDGFTLISNSDTHSPAKLGRETNVFAGTPGYLSIRDGIKRGGSSFRRLLGEQWEQGLTAIVESNPDMPEGFVGTVEFFPEEGKYHLDGHRKCASRLDPRQTEELGGKCPVCGHPVTVGVMNRVNELADRDPGQIPDHAGLFWRMLPLVEVVSQALGVGPQSKKVEALYLDLLQRLGPEMAVLCFVPLDELGRQAPPVIREAMRRVRTGAVAIEAGFDGEYGKVELFGPGERESLAGQESFFSVQTPGARKPRRGTAGPRKKKGEEAATDTPAAPMAPALNYEQQRCLHITDRPVLVQAGPGTGKTRTLTHRIASLIQSGKALPETITAVTFTRKAAQELRERLELLIAPQLAQRCWVGTFHQLGGRILEHLAPSHPSAARERTLDADRALDLFKEAIKGANVDPRPSSLAQLFAQVSLLKQNLAYREAPSEDSVIARAYHAYEDLLLHTGAYDLDDLLVWPVRLLSGRGNGRSELPNWTENLLVDEFQDVNLAQYEMVRLLAPEAGKGLFAIGDPDQAIYGFRGADRELFFRFCNDYPDAATVTLSMNYRSQPAILRSAEQMLRGRDVPPSLVPQWGEPKPITVATAPNPAIEAKFIVRTIDSMLGGSSFYSMDTRNVSRKASELGLRDFGVLFRLNAVGEALEEEFKASGIPFKRARSAKPEDEAEQIDPRVEAVSLMTIHASKGLEFPVVFVAGCEDGIIPYTRQHDHEAAREDPDEERRLLYVAMTRARNDLYLTRSMQRHLFGMQQYNPVSRFLEEIDPGLYEAVDPLGKGKKRNRSTAYQCELFQY